MNIEGNLVNSIITDCQETSTINITSSGGKGFPGSRVVKIPPANAGDMRDTGVIPGLGRSRGGENGCPFQYSGLENSMDYIVHEVAKSRTAERLSLHFTSLHFSGGTW